MNPPLVNAILRGLLQWARGGEGALAELLRATTTKPGRYVFFSVIVFPNFDLRQLQVGKEGEERENGKKIQKLKYKNIIKLSK